MSACAAVQHALAHDCVSCSEDTSLGAALLQTTRGALSIASGQFPNPDKLVDAESSVAPGSFSLEIVSLGAIISVLGGLLYWCIYFRRPWSAAAATTQSTERQQSVVTERQSEANRWRNAAGGDSSDDPDWQPSSIFLSQPSSEKLASAAEALGFGSATANDLVSKPSDAEDPCVWDYLEESNSSWVLFFRVMGHLAQVWGMLAVLYWNLVSRDDELMECLAHPHSKFVSHLCMYTHGCLRGFPILAANMTLVMMMRILVQNRIYYSLLRLGYVLDFEDCHIMRSTLPWMFSISMLQGGAHLVLKMVVDPNPISYGSYASLVRTFVVPGAIFVAFFVRFSEIENTLVPLNRLVEQDLKKGLDEHNHVQSNSLPCLSTLRALDERVLCFDARHRDIVGNVMDDIGRAPTINDIMENMTSTFEQASEKFYTTRKHSSWGFFRSLWPAAVLVDKRLDRCDPKTWSWLITFGIVSVGSMVVSFLSICFFISSIYRDILLGRQHQTTQGISAGPFGYVVTETILEAIVLSVHAFNVLYVIHKAIRGMFYFEMTTTTTYMDSTGAL